MNGIIVDEMRIGLTYDLQTDPDDARQAEFDPPRTIQALETALHELGHDLVHIGNADALLAFKPRLSSIDLVVNLAEGWDGRCREAVIPMLLELWRVPMVGSGATAQALGLDKLMCKRIAAASGLLTPAWIAIERPSDLLMAPPFGYPAIVKPRYGGSGMGIDPGAIVHDEADLHRRVQWAMQRFNQPCLVEELIPFGELTVFLIGNGPPEALPAIQRPLSPRSRLSCHVAREAEGAPWLSPIELTPALDQAARRVAVTIFEALGCQDMARVDLRVDDQHRVYFLEVNPLPSLDPEGSLGLLAEYLGTTYRALVGQVVEASLKRMGMHVV